MTINFSGNQWMSTTKPIPLEKNFTIEALMILDESGVNPSIISQPLKDVWEYPHVSFWLGFHESTRRPKFEFSLKKNSKEKITLISPSDVQLKYPLHIGVTFDGKVAKLFIRGREECSIVAKGTLSSSDQPAVMGCRSSVDPGGYLIGRLNEIRILNYAKSPTEMSSSLYKKSVIEKSRSKEFTPAKEKFIALWSA